MLRSDRQQILIHCIDVDGTPKLVRERERAILDFRIGMPTRNDQSNKAYDHVLSEVLVRLRPVDAFDVLALLEP